MPRASRAVQESGLGGPALQPLALAASLAPSHPGGLPVCQESLAKWVVPSLPGKSPCPWLRSAHLVAQVPIGLFGDKQCRHVRVPLLGSKVQRHHTLHGLSVSRGPVLQQAAGHLQLVLLGRNVQGGVTVLQGERSHSPGRRWAALLGPNQSTHGPGSRQDCSPQHISTAPRLLSLCQSQRLPAGQPKFKAGQGSERPPVPTLTGASQGLPRTWQLLLLLASGSAFGQCPRDGV